MKSIFQISLLLILANFNVTAQYSQGAKDSVQIEIQQLTNEWNNAIINRDSLTLDKILASEYSLNGSVNRAIWINNTQHHLTTDTLEILGQLNIIFYGQAVKSEGTFYWKAAYDGKPKIKAKKSKRYMGEKRMAREK